MSVGTYRAILWLILLVGIAAGGTYLVLYKAWQPRRWRSILAQDASGWVVVLWLLYLWSGLRLLVNQVTGNTAASAPLPGFRAQLVTLALGFGLDGAFVMRLWRYWQAVREERRHPTRICTCCSGAGVVLIDGKVQHGD